MKYRRRVFFMDKQKSEILHLGEAYQSAGTACCGAKSINDGRPMLEQEIDLDGGMLGNLEALNPDPGWTIHLGSIRIRYA